MRESTDERATSEDEELSDLGHGSMHFVSSMVKNSDKIDQRFIDLFNLRQQEYKSLQEESKEKVPKPSNQIEPSVEMPVLESQQDQ